MDRNKTAALWLAQGTAVAALYVVLTLIFAPISFGSVQFRIAEILTTLPLLTPAAVPGLFVGCLLGNILGGAIIWDIVFGSLATLIGAALGYLLRFNRWLVPLPTVIANALIIPWVLRYGYGIQVPILLQIAYVAAGEIPGCYILGELLATVLLKRRDIFPNARWQH
ncbi:MAG: QueT transporter family protein [Oscillospiraceae bacterium]|nr:QueT transporter family protein [Oscillospiraceae bacterium]